jgi:hypothetical protein
VALLQQKEDGKWVPLITLECPEHGTELTLSDPNQEVSEWRCNEDGCSVRVLVKIDRERLKKLKLAGP